MSKPTIVFVPGAWHSPTTFSVVVHQLKEAGYATHLVALPSVGTEPPVTDMTADTTKIRKAITSITSAGKTVILVMHSYGGVCGSSAIRDLPGIDDLIYICALLLLIGVSLFDATGGKQIPWWGVSEDQTWMFPTIHREKFYDDLTENEADAAVSVLKPHSYGTFTSKATNTPWVDNPTTCVVCELDQAITIEVQRAMVKGAQKESTVTIKTETLKSGQSPFYSMPNAVVSIIRRAAGECVNCE